MFTRKKYSLKSHNTFGLDVIADQFIEINSNEQLNDLNSFKNFNFENLLILGSGSNLLFLEDYKGVVLKLSFKGIVIDEENNDFVIVKAYAGEEWDNLAHFAAKKNYGGIENLSMIPGTVGAAPIQNIGAYGQELKDVFVSCKAIDLKNFSTRIFQKEECQFGYRNSIFKKEFKNRYLITWVKLKLSKNPVPNVRYGSIEEELRLLNKKKYSISDVRDVVCYIRTEKLPDYQLIGNAGSFFKNPEIPESDFEILQSEYKEIPFYKNENNLVKIPAGWLIEKSGWKGRRDGDVGTHSSQALIIVNYGGATGQEIYDFALKIKEDIKTKFNIILEEEVNVISSPN
ncbi:MAG: UDP-N-acetylenolpyruvoylglucosamine reductase [Chlorobiaceae bacterium]|nr:UDP-N-acetylenolpyruvoylglucosamine reductase [Chlorobiaceae bacterium]MBA4310422.1 UDP-N-acetylenolpyruvoylglucosamine reductase [Chlorobiaceae bacterium]